MVEKRQSMPWLKLWCDFLHDPKVQMLSEVDQRRYLMVLIVKMTGELAKTPDTATLAWKLHIEETSCEQTLQVLVRRGLLSICDGMIDVVGWHKRQDKDPEAAERKRKQRAKRPSIADHSGSRLSIECHADVTTRSQVVTGGHADVTECHPELELDSELEEDEDKIPLSPPAGGTGNEAEGSSPKRSRRATRNRELPTHNEQTAIDECKALYLQAATRWGFKPLMAAADAALLRWMRNYDGIGKVMDALNHLNEHRPKPEQTSQPWWKLEWLLRRQASQAAGGHPVDRIQEILDGGFDAAEEAEPERDYTREELDAMRSKNNPEVMALLGDITDGAEEGGDERG